MAEGNRKIRSDTDRRDDKGRFGAGNPGRPRGSKNRTTAIAQALLADEEVELVRQGHRTSQGRGRADVEVSARPAFAEGAIDQS